MIRCVSSFVSSFVRLFRALVQSVKKLNRGSARRNSRRKRTHFEVGRNLHVGFGLAVSAPHRALVQCVRVW